MILLKNAEEKYNKFIQLNNKTSKGRNDIRFLMQWVAEMEMKISEGDTINNCAWNTFYETKKRLETTYNIENYLDIIESIWIYGKELKTWYCFNRNNQEFAASEEPKSIICMSKHARKRMHTRCGLNKKAQNRIAELAYFKGTSINESSGFLRDYMIKVLDNTEDRDQALVRTYGDKIYVYKKLENCILLVTVMHIPTGYTKFVKYI